MENQEVQKSDSKIALQALLTIFIWMLLVAFFVLIFCWVDGKLPESSERLGQLGDFFGGILNPLFSLGSFVLLAISLLYTLRAFEASIEANKVAMLGVKTALTQLEFDHKKLEKEAVENEKKTKRDLTLAWHQNWMSPQMALQKANALGEIQTRILNIETGQARAFIGGSRNAGVVQIRKTYQEIKDVMRLIHHAITFFEDELLEKELFLKLFESDLRQWHSVLNRLDMRANPSDESPDSLLEDAERWGLVERLARVLGL